MEPFRPLITNKASRRPSGPMLYGSIAANCSTRLQTHGMRTVVRDAKMRGHFFHSCLRTSFLPFLRRRQKNLTMMLKVKMNPPNDKLPLSLQRKEPDKEPDILLVICSDKVNHSANQLVYSITVTIGINTCSLCLMVRAYHWSQKQKRRHARTLKTIHTRTPNSSERCSRSRHRAWRKPLPSCASRSRNAKRTMSPEKSWKRWRRVPDTMTRSLPYIDIARNIRMRADQRVNFIFFHAR